MHRIVNYKYSGNQSELLFAFKISGGSSPLKAAIIIIIIIPDKSSDRQTDIQYLIQFTSAIDHLVDNWE